MVVTNKRIETRQQLFVGADQIKEVKSFKYLGIYVDTQLKYNAQIKHLKSKSSQLCGVSFRLSNFLNFQAAKNMFNSCIYSKKEALRENAYGRKAMSVLYMIQLKALSQF